jgi:valyl-tRNA synthetase
VIRALETLAPLLRHLARLSEVRFAPAASGVLQDVVAGLTLGLLVRRGSSAESSTRIEKALAEIDAEVGRLSSKLQNAAYLAKAPAPIVEKARRRLLELEEKRAALGKS